VAFKALGEQAQAAAVQVHPFQITTGIHVIQHTEPLGSQRHDPKGAVPSALPERIRCGLWVYLLAIDVVGPSPATRGERRGRRDRSHRLILSGATGVLLPLDVHLEDGLAATISA
jgi:hypothetical protein